MSFSLRSISNVLPSHFNTRLLGHSQAFNIQRGQLAPTITQRHYYHPWIRKAVESVTGIKPTTPQETKRALIKIAMESITGMKMLNPEERAQAIIDHQKLAVAHYSINNPTQSLVHHERVYSMQLFDHPKDFNVQRYYVTLVDKKKEELSLKELQEVVGLYQFAIANTTSYLEYYQLKKKAEVYQAALEKLNRPNGT